jgi:hypothetical protein
MGIRRVNRAINKRQLVLRKRGSVAGDGIELPTGGFSSVTVARLLSTLEHQINESKRFGDLFFPVHFTGSRV